MRAKKVNENINFQRGESPKKTLNMGMERFNKFLLVNQDEANKIPGYIEAISDAMGLPPNEIYKMGEKWLFYDYSNRPVMRGWSETGPISEKKIKVMTFHGTSDMKLSLFETKDGPILSAAIGVEWPNDGQVPFYGGAAMMKTLLKFKWIEL